MGFSLLQQLYGAGFVSSNSFISDEDQAKLKLLLAANHTGISSKQATSLINLYNAQAPLLELAAVNQL